MGPVDRLKKTWQSLADKFPKMLDTFKELSAIVSSKFQYANYRKYVKEMNPPAIPFLGVYLTDLTFIEDGNPDYVSESHLINFDKRQKVYQLICDKIKRYQHEPYLLQPVKAVQDYLEVITKKKTGKLRGNDQSKFGAGASRHGR
jgi:son of sevenless-like protein